MPRVAIIGSGLVGRAWAMVFCRAGWDVAMFDAVDGVADKALGLIADGLNELARNGLVDDPKGAAARVRAAKSFADALDGVSFVQENVPETLDAKRAIFAELDALAAPDAGPRAPDQAPPAAPDAGPSALPCGRRRGRPGLGLGSLREGAGWPGRPPPPAATAAGPASFALRRFSSVATSSSSWNPSSPSSASLP